MRIGELAWVILALAGFGVIVYVPKLLIDLAWERKGRWLTVAWIVNGLCIAIAVPVAGYALIIGAAKLSDKSWPTFLVSAGALTFVIYFYYKKSQPKRKGELTPKLAEEIIDQYAEALATEPPDGGETARYESSLPCSKERIKQACKVMLAFLIEYDMINQDYAKKLLSAIMHLGSFVPDEKANRINNNRTLANEEYSQFVTSMIDSEIRLELDKFIEQVERLDSYDPLFHQRICTLIGLEYSPAMKQSFREHYAGKL